MLVKFLILAGKMAQWVKVLAATLKDLGSIQKPHSRRELALES